MSTRDRDLVAGTDRSDTVVLDLVPLEMEM